MDAQSLEQAITSIASLGRDDVKNRILEFGGRVPLDFTQEHLEAQTTERLQHILFGIVTTFGQM